MRTGHRLLRLIWWGQEKGAERCGASRQLGRGEMGSSKDGVPRIASSSRKISRSTNRRRSQGGELVYETYFLVDGSSYEATVGLARLENCGRFEGTAKFCVN